MCEAKITPFIEAESVELFKQKLEVNASNEGFYFKSQGYGEDFLLQLVSKLKGQEVEATIVPKVADVPISVVVTTDAIKVTEDNEVALKSSLEALKKNPPSPLSEKFGDKAKELYDIAGVEHTEPTHDYFHTGIKYDDQKRPKYRCAYECPKCGESGRHYIPLHITRVSCHACNTPLVVEPATELGKGGEEKHRDENGNFMYAEVIDYTVKTWDKSGK